MKAASPLVNVNERIYNHPALKARRRALRRNSTAVEKSLWEALRDKRVGGWKFRRQFSVGRYVLDFYCPKARLNIELDGSQHFSKQGRQDDAARDAYLNCLRIKVLRFENGLVEKNIDFVLKSILAHLPTSPNPSLDKERKQLSCGNVNVGNGEVGTQL